MSESAALAKILERAPFVPEVAIVLGSGTGRNLGVMKAFGARS